MGWEPAERRDLLLDCGDSGDELGLAISPKSKYESISVVVPFHSPLRSRTRVKREAYNLEEGNDKCKFWMVVERMIFKTEAYVSTRDPGGKGREVLRAAATEAKDMDDDKVANLEAIYWNASALNSALASCLITTTTGEVGIRVFERCKNSQELASVRGRI